jgi:uncharacterized protein YndB with AHSA1/START domain
MRIIKWLLALIVLIGVAVFGGGFLLPKDVAVSRQIEIAAPPEKIFAIVSNLKRFNEWSPWADLDPDTKYSFEGPDAAAGQTMRWDSANSNVGSGMQKITELAANQKVVSDLDFGGSKALATVTLAPAGTGTKVVWGFSATLSNPVERWFGLMFDRWIGGDYEKGLAALKTLAEKP